jgi:hypothetical protein
MTPELTALALAGLLQAVQFASSPSPRMSSWAPPTPPARATPRRPPALPPPAGCARDEQPFRGLILFTLAVTVVTLGNQSTRVTQYAAWTYLGAASSTSPPMPWLAPLALGDLGGRLLRNPDDAVAALICPFITQHPRGG